MFQPGETGSKVATLQVEGVQFALVPWLFTWQCEIARTGSSGNSLCGSGKRGCSCGSWCVEWQENHFSSLLCPYQNAEEKMDKETTGL